VSTNQRVQLLDGDLLRITAQRGFDSPFLEFFDDVHSEQAACGTALQRAERVIVDDVLKSPIFEGTPALEVISAYVQLTNWYRKSRLQRVNRNGVSLITSSRSASFARRVSAPCLCSMRSAACRALDVEEAQGPVAGLLRRVLVGVLRTFPIRGRSGSRAASTEPPVGVLRRPPVAAFSFSRRQPLLGR
jgi:hypothetical protein